MNSPGLQQRTRCSRSLRIGSLLLVHPLSSDETRVSPLQKGDNVPKILLLTKYPYGLSFLLWPCRDVHTFPMRYVTVLACEHSYPLHLDLESRPQATGHYQISAQVPSATGHSGYPHKTFQPRPESKQLDTPAIRTWTLWLSAQDFLAKARKQATGHSSYPHKSSQATGHSSYPHKRSFVPIQGGKESPQSQRTEESGRPGLCPVNPNSSGLLYGTFRHPSRLHVVCYQETNLRKIIK